MLRPMAESALSEYSEERNSFKNLFLKGEHEKIYNETFSMIEYKTLNGFYKLKICFKNNITQKDFYEKAINNTMSDIFKIVDLALQKHKFFIKGGFNKSGINKKIRLLRRIYMKKIMKFKKELYAAIPILLQTLRD